VVSRRLKVVPRTVFITDHPDNAAALRRPRYEVAEDMNILIHTAVLDVFVFKFTSEDLNRAKAPNVCRRHGKLLYIHFGTYIGTHKDDASGME